MLDEFLCGDIIYVKCLDALLVVRSCYWNHSGILSPKIFDPCFSQKPVSEQKLAWNDVQMWLIDCWNVWMDECFMDAWKLFAFTGYVHKDFWAWDSIVETCTHERKT